MLEVTTGSRLHFGLLELAAGQPHRYGGLGLMLATPGWQLRFSRDSRTKKPVHANPEVVERVEQVRRRFAGLNCDISNIAIEVTRSLPLHSGLGSGTQLAAAVAAGLHQYLQRELAEPPSSELNASPLTLERLIQLSGRGKRSGIGLYGFLNGGLILDTGFPAGFDEPSTTPKLSPRPLEASASQLNPDWRIVLVIPGGSPAVTGGYESSLMELASRHSNPHRQRMFDLAQRAMQLSHSISGFDEFTATVDEYLQFAGQLFSICQAGNYNGEAVRKAVELAKQAGLRAVGQSSWGPAVFGFMPDELSANNMARTLTELMSKETWSIQVVMPALQGASWNWISQG